MNTNLLYETTQIKQELRLLQITIQTLQLRIEQLIGQLYQQNNGVGLFSSLEGIWEDADWSLEAIQAAEYRIPQDLL